MNQTPQDDDDTFKYRAAIASDLKPDLEQLITLSNPSYQAILTAVDSYVSGLERTWISLSSFGEITFKSARHVTFALNALHETAKVYCTPLHEIDEIAKKNQGMGALYKKQSADFKNLTEHQLDEVLDIYGLQLLIKLLHRSDEGGKAFKALYTGVIIESYLYFEVFAGDLWAAAVDDGHAIFRGNVMDCEEWDKEDKIKVRDVCKLGYDPGKRVGTFYRDIGKASFQKLSTIRKNYEILFNKTDKKLKANKDFLKGDLDLLSAYRNAIVHRAGKADRHFIDKVKPYAEFRHIKDGEELPLDGEIVARLRKASIVAATELLTKVLAVQDPAPAK